jgi:AcrR family transcriptional regulator
MALLKVRQKRSLERRRAIVAAAIDVFGRKGAHAATLTDISILAGVPLPSLYDYFENKTRLLACLPAAIFEEFYAAVDPLIAAEPDPVEQVRIFYLETLRYMERHPAWARVFFLEIWPGTLVREAEVRAAVDGFGRRIIDIIKRGIDSKKLAASNDPYLLMSIILGSMTHLVAVWLLYPRRFSLLQQGERAMALLHPTIVASRAKTRQRYGHWRARTARA